MGYIGQSTPQYATFIKRAVVEALLAAFTDHPDPTVSGSKVAVDYTGNDFKLPAVIIKYYEGKITNAGVGHFEWLPYPLTADPTNPDTVYVQYQHRMYKGDIEFEIFGMSSPDRDILGDAIIDVLAMDEVSVYGTLFLERFYGAFGTTPYGLWHFPTLNTDVISGMGEQAQLAPWNPEDQLVYQKAYRIPIFGEFYSYTPQIPTSVGPIAEVDVYAWPTDGYGNPIDPQLPAPPVPSEDYMKFTGAPADGESI